MGVVYLKTRIDAFQDRHLNGVINFCKFEYHCPYYHLINQKIHDSGNNFIWKSMTPQSFGHGYTKVTQKLYNTLTISLFWSIISLNFRISLNFERWLLLFQFINLAKTSPKHTIIHPAVFSRLSGSWQSTFFASGPTPFSTTTPSTQNKSVLDTNWEKHVSCTVL